MDKFSIYDLLGLILPGAVLIFLLNTIRMIFGIFPKYNFTDNWEIIVLFSIILGAILYMMGFILVNKTKWFPQFFGVYKSTGELYMEMTELHNTMNKQLNKRATEWYGKPIFPDIESYTLLPKKEKEKLSHLHGNFYERMYYELDYNEKLSIPKSFQGFYFFFRQLIIATSISIVVLMVCFAMSFFNWWSADTISLYEFIGYFVFLVIVILLFTWLARWYRKRMVTKMYWYFYMHINSQK